MTVADTARVPRVAWLLLLANVLWVTVYDTMYAMVDRDDDVRIGIRTAAITFGRHDVLAVMLCYAGMLVVLAGIGLHQRMGVYYYLGLMGAAGMMMYHWGLIRGREGEACFRCRRPLVRARFSNRSTFYCEACQV